MALHFVFLHFEIPENVEGCLCAVRGGPTLSPAPVFLCEHEEEEEEDEDQVDHGEGLKEVDPANFAAQSFLSRHTTVLVVIQWMSL